MNAAAAFQGLNRGQNLLKLCIAKGNGICHGGNLRIVAALTL